jgi:2-methylcitrate dehydratase PrpD
MVSAARASVAETVGPTQQLADFVSGVSSSGVPDNVRAVLQDAVVDAVGCGLFGLTTQACGIVQAYAAEQGGPPQATLWASGGRKVSAANAVLAAGTAIHGFDFDDHHRSKIHPGAAVLPVVLALGEQHDIDGPTFLAALAAGYETMARVSLAANPNAARMRGWHLTGTTGTFGAAAAASVILGFDPATTASSLGLAGTQSAGLWAFNADGAMSKRLHPGRAAQSGLIAAALAGRGFQGPRFILEAKDGGFLAAMSDESRPEEIGRELGRTWRTGDVCFKPYACCGSNHASVDAAIALMKEYGFGAGDVARVTVAISRVVEKQTGFPYRQSTVLNAQMSIRYNVAVALLDGTALVEQFAPERIAAADVNELTSRVDVEVTPEMDAVYPERYAGVVTIRLRDGREVRKRVDFSRGMPENKLSAEGLQQKFHSLAGTAVGSEAAARLSASLHDIFECDSIAAVSRTLGALLLKV